MRKVFLVLAAAAASGCTGNVKPQQLKEEPLPTGLRIVQDAPVFQCTPASIKYNERSTQLDMTCK